MRFCTHCGAQIPDNAKFCTACGTPIDAPDEATVIISDPEETTVEAGEIETSAEDGEIVAASWHAETKPASPAAGVPKPETRVETKAQAKAVETGPIIQPVRKKGFFHYLWLYIKIIILVVAIVLAAVFVKGLIQGQGTTGSNPAHSPETTVIPDGDGFQSLDELSASELEEYTKTLLGRTDNKPAKEKKVTVGTVTFLLSGEYKIASRERLQNGEACIIIPKNATNRRNRLKLVIVPGDSEDAIGFTSEEMYGILSGAVDELEEELAEGKYDIHYEDNADGKYFPHCYSFRNLQNPRAYTYTEATFVSGNLLSGCCVATDEAELAALMEIYSAAVVGAFI